MPANDVQGGLHLLGCPDWAKTLLRAAVLPGVMGCGLPGGKSRLVFLCAEHVQQLRGESPPANLMICHGVACVTRLCIDFRKDRFPLRLLAACRFCTAESLFIAVSIPPPLVPNGDRNRILPLQHLSVCVHSLSKRQLHIAIVPAGGVLQVDFLLW